MAYKDNLSALAIKEKYEDLVFSRVMKIYMESEYEKSQPEFVKTPDLSPIEKLYSKQERKKTFLEVWGTSKKAFRFAAGLAFIGLISVIVSVAAFADIRVAVAEVLYSIITEDNSLYTEVSIGAPSGFIDPELYDWEGAYAPTYMPKGFEFENKVFTKDEKTTVYTCDNEYISFYQRVNTNITRINTEEFDVVKNIQIGNSEAVAIYYNNKWGFYWGNGNTLFRVEGNAPYEELLLVAESIKVLR